MERRDILPFDYEQGVAFTGSGLVFSSRSSLVRTTLGCPAPLDPGVPCYDAEVRNSAAIPLPERLRGFNHVGAIDVGLTGPARGLVYAPLETSSPRTVRGYMAYALSTLEPAGELIEEIPHRNHSWVAVDPSGRFLIAADSGVDVLRVHELSANGGIARREDLDLRRTSDRLPNLNGCSFQDSLTIYCTDWESVGVERDVRTVVHRLDMSAPIGAEGATFAGKRVVNLKLPPAYPGTENVPWHMETEGVTFYEGRMHVHLRGPLAWFYYLHLAPGA